MTGPASTHEDGWLDNLGLKLVSVLCALGFFLFIRGAEQAELRYDVGVAHSQPPEDARRILVKEPPTQVSVTLRGPRTMLESLPRDLGTLTLDLSTGYESVIEVTRDSIPNIPNGVEVVQVFPPRIEVRWDDVVSRELPVQVAVVGQPAEGHIVSGGVTLIPSSVTATGPRTIVDLMQIARGAAVDISGVTAGTDEQILPLDFPPTSVEYSVPSVKAQVVVVREERTVPFKAVKVEVVGAPGATTRPETVTVKVRGVREVVNAVEADQLVPRVELPADVDLKKKGSAMAKVLLKIQNATVEIEPQEVLVKW